MARAKRELPRLAPEEARAYLVGQLGLRRSELPKGARGVRALIEKLRCIQLDPLEPLGSNADLVTLARVEGIGLGDVYRYAYPGFAFEHFAKERCLLPASAFPHYRDAAAETPWWRLSERLRKLAPGLIDAVLEEVRARGPLTAESLQDRGKVAPMDWAGWTSTGRASFMALQVLWTRCQVVVCGRVGGRKLYDLPERALPLYANAHPQAAAGTDPGEAFERWALLERVEAAGLLSKAGGATWSMLTHGRVAMTARLLEEGLLEEVIVGDSPRPYLAPKGFRERRFPKPDGRMRLLGPLDPLLWDRPLVRAAFGFDYVWEVYKPAHKRRWAWYVCPILHGDSLVARIDGALEPGALRVRKLWREPGVKLDKAALRDLLERHAKACGVPRVLLR